HVRLGRRRHRAAGAARACSSREERARRRLQGRARRRSTRPQPPHAEPLIPPFSPDPRGFASAWSNACMGRSFDSLVNEAAAVSVEGWDFAWLDGRATEERPSWGYQRLLGGRLATATAALDIQTGGGEVLAGAGAENFPPTLVATE